jgi:hypothetical protein
MIERSQGEAVTRRSRKGYLTGAGLSHSVLLDTKSQEGEGGMRIGKAPQNSGA